MLALPTSGISRSITTHNIDLDMLCDWIEASVLFEEDELSQTDVLDTLMEENIYAEHDMGLEIVTSAWTEIRRRQSWVAEGTPFSITRGRISRVREWKTIPGHSFCLLLSLAKVYSGWARQFGSDYTEQGELFEELTKESLVHQFRDWNFFLTGWSRTRTTHIRDLVERIALELGESKGNISRWTNDDKNDAELDILCYRPFRDGRVGVPVYLIQCASGGNWESKVHTPRLEIWNRLIDWAAHPKKGFAIPFAMINGKFIQKCGLVDGLFLDRYRILGAVKYRKRWISPQLRRRLVAWSSGRVSALPRRDR